jgi:flagellar biosynthesis/type III secretory pathway protein FliH
MSLRHFSIAVAVLVAAPACATTQWTASRPGVPAVYADGYDRGLRAGRDDARRGEPFGYVDEQDYRRARVDTRGGNGPADRLREEFRRGFAAGYRDGYVRADAPAPRPGSGWDRGPQPGRRGPQYDRAVSTGYEDGYDAGLDAGRDGRAFDPIREKRYRAADRGFDRGYGSREVYAANYRTGFRNGYEDGYRDGRRDRR